MTPPYIQCSTAKEAELLAIVLRRCGYKYDGVQECYPGNDTTMQQFIHYVMQTLHISKESKFTRVRRGFFSLFSSS